MKRTSYIRKFSLGLIMVLGIIFLLPSTANADTGPKPSIDLIVRGLDTEDYWLDLLVTDEPEYSWLDITEDEKSKVSKLAEYEDEDGFHPALLVGSDIPIIGELKGKKQENGSYLHKFSYNGVPKTFKIAILKSDGTLIISKVVNRVQYQTVIEYTLENLNTDEKVILSAGETTEKIPLTQLITGFLLRLFATLIIEIIIAILFGFKSKSSVKILLITNLLTQIILNIIVLSSCSINGQLHGLFTFALGELIVIFIEVIVYSNLLTERNKLWRIGYALCANIVSLMAGFWLLSIP